MCVCVCACTPVCELNVFVDPLLTFGSPFIFRKYNLFLSTPFLPKLFIILILPTSYFSSFLPFPLTKLPP